MPPAQAPANALAFVAPILLPDLEAGLKIRPPVATIGLFKCVLHWHVRRSIC
jgi:hypothetical protein